jgi:hypothetical protein
VVTTITLVDQAEEMDQVQLQEELVMQEDMTLLKEIMEEMVLVPVLQLITAEAVEALAKLVAKLVVQLQAQEEMEVLQQFQDQM